MSFAPKKRKFTPERVAELTQALKNWVEAGGELWLGKFAQLQGIHRNHLALLANEHEEFCKAYELAKQAQENWLVTAGMKKEIDVSMAIFSLKNVAGWRDKLDIEQEIGERTLEQLERMSVEELQKRAHELTGGRRSAN